MSTQRRRLLSVAGALWAVILATPIARVRAETAPEVTPPSTTRPDDLTSVQIKEPTSFSQPRKLRAFLEELLGIEVRVSPAAFRPFTLQAGEVPVRSLLDEVARHSAQPWRLEFEFVDPATRPRQLTSASKLPALSRLSLPGYPLPLRTVLRTVEESGCVILGEALPQYWKVLLRKQDQPVPEALTEIAGYLRRPLRTRVAFYSEPEWQEAETAEMMKRTNAESDADLGVAARLREWYGVDAEDESFPWGQVDQAQLAQTLARDLNLTTSEAGESLSRLQVAGESRRSTAATNAENEGT